MNDKTIQLPKDKQFSIYGCKVVAIRTIEYHDGNLAVLALFANGENQAISCNLPRDAWQLEENEFFVKNWSENEELAGTLIRLGILILTGRSVPTGFVQAPICRLGIE